MSKKNGSDNNIVPNLKKLPLAEYFAALPKAHNVIVIQFVAGCMDIPNLTVWLKKRLWLRSYNQMSQPYFLKERRNDYDWNGILFHS